MRTQQKTLFFKINCCIISINHKLCLIKGAIAMNQMSFKNVFCKILLNDKQREKMTSSKDIGSAYELFCKNGYSKSLDEFKVEMNNFLSSADGQKIMNNDFNELSDEMLEMVAGGVNVKQIATTCVAALMATFCISGAITPVGAAGGKTMQPTQQSQDVLTSVDNYNNIIANPKQEKEKLEKEKKKKIDDLDKGIKYDNEWITALNALGNDIDQQSKTTLDELKLKVKEKTKLKENLDKEYSAKILNLNNKIKEQEIPKGEQHQKQNKNEININDNKADKEKQQKEKELNQRYKNKLQELQNVRKKIAELLHSEKDKNFARAQVKALGACLNLHKELQNNFTVDVATKMIKEADKVINEVNEHINKNKAEQNQEQEKLGKQKQQLITDIEDYQKTIDEFEKNKEQIKKQQENEIKKLNNEIEDEEQLLNFLNGLKERGEDQEKNIKEKERSINANKEKIKKISTDGKKEINNLNKWIEESKTEKEKLEKKLNNLLDREEHENIKVEKLDKEKFQNKNDNEDIIKEIPFENLLAGDQHVDNKMIVEKQEIEVKNTCGIHMITTLKNIYDFVGGNKTQPVRGFKNVIDNYLDQGGSAKFLFEPLEEGKVGQALASDDFRGFLKNNGIGMNRLDFSESIYLIGDKKEDEKTVSNCKGKWKKNIAEFLKSYMRGKNFAPVGTVGGGHWQLLAKLNDKGDKILRLDSAPAKAEWVDLDTVAENFIRYNKLGDESVFFNFEMLIFNQNRNFEDKKIEDADNFTKKKQQEIINKIG